MFKLLCYICLSLPLLSIAAPKTFFDIAISKNKDMIKKIQAHPFNQELNQGNLPPALFKEFTKQDDYYLTIYNQFAKKLYRRLTKQQQQQFLLVESLALEQPKPSFSKIKLTPANYAYTNFLLKTAKQHINGALIAAMLPCQWLYQVVYNKSKTIQKYKLNPYQSWLSTYQTKSYHQATQHFIHLANQVYIKAKPQNQKLMLKAFSNAVNFEYQFWNDIYRNKL